MARRKPRAARRIVTTGAAAAVTVGSVMFASGPTAQAEPTAQNEKVQVAAGSTVATLPVTQVFGTTDPSTPETVSFILKMRGEDQLSRQVEAGMDQDDFLTPDQFARRHGRSDRELQQLTEYLNGFGIQTEVLGGKLDIVAHGTAGQFDKALTIQQENVQTSGVKGGHRQRVHAPKEAPMLPRHLANMVTAILGLSNYAPFTSQASHVAADQLGQAPAAGSAGTCPVSTARDSACHLPTDFASRYGLKPLQQAGNTGVGRTVGIVTLAAYDPGAAETFWSKYMGLDNSVRSLTVQDIDGGPGAPSATAGSDETDLDVEQAGGLATGSNVVVYQAPNTDSGWVDAFFQAAAQNTADTVSSSWGQSEANVQASIASGAETPAVQEAYDEAFLELAAQGQSNFLSSGDEGAYTAWSDLQTTNLSADYPSDSPYVTSAGGTTLPWTGTFHNGNTSVTVNVPQERAWGWDYLWQPLATLRGEDLLTAAKGHIGGGGGGYSVTEPRPSYQKGISGVDRFSAVQYLTPISWKNVSGLSLPTDWTLNMNPSVVSGVGVGRAQADVSADADPYSGYLLYAPSAEGGALQAGWGGTSFVAPQFNGSTAVIDQAVGHRIGLWNPSMYRAARSHNSPVTPINTQGTASTNLYYTGTPGTLYNPAVGLGTPNLAVYANKVR